MQSLDQLLLFCLICSGMQAYQYAWYCQVWNQTSFNLESVHASATSCETSFISSLFLTISSIISVILSPSVDPEVLLQVECKKHQVQYTIAYAELNNHRIQLIPSQSCNFLHVFGYPSSRQCKYTLLFHPIGSLF